MSELPKRGQSPFDDAALIQALAAPPWTKNWFEIDSALYLSNTTPTTAWTLRRGKTRLWRFCRWTDRIFTNLFTRRSKSPWPGRLFAMVTTITWGYTVTLVNELLQRNIAVVGFDQIGHGLSTGAQATIEDFQRYIQVIEIAYNSPAPG